MQQSLVTSSKIDRDGGSPAVTLSTLLSSPAWSLWRSPSFVALVRAVFVGHRILRRTSVTLFARPERAEYGVPRPVDNTSPGLPRMGPHSQSWQWKKEGRKLSPSRSDTDSHCYLVLTRCLSRCKRSISAILSQDERGADRRSLQCSSWFGAAPSADVGPWPVCAHR
ncbi:uncharacterized protein LOC135829594 isoform X1 [Sycon ciliatum]|uniref:uncharacterized protein LOC135829594 isoform X1 n=1 Tax=Sycon ciliatum TaxID=27933 RepID=UPI0031F6312E